MKVCSRGLHNYTPYEDNKRGGCLECRKLYMKTYIKEWSKLNREKRRGSCRKYRSNNLEKERTRTLKFQKENPALYAFNEAKHRKVVKERTPKWLTKGDWIEIKWAYKIANEITKETGIKHEVDHVIPLQGKNVSGLNCPQNLQILTKFENISKHNKFNERKL